jgi:hypothetical protein
MSVAEIVDAYPTLSEDAAQGALRDLAHEKEVFVDENPYAAALKTNPEHCIWWWSSGHQFKRTRHWAQI